MGTPGKVVKELTPEQVPPDLFTLFKCSRWAKACAGWAANFGQKGADGYVKNSARFKRDLCEI
eukprot:786064-Rhodomonas_salina.1